MKDKTTVTYKMAKEMARKICEHYEVDIDTLEEWEVCVLIDDFLSTALLLMEAE